MENVKVTEKSMEVLSYLQAHDGRATIDELAEALERNARSISANVTDLCSEKKGLCVREKVEVEGHDKPVTYAVLTDAGMAYPAV